MGNVCNGKVGRKFFSCDIEEFTCGDGLCLPLGQRYDALDFINIMKVILINIIITIMSKILIVPTKIRMTISIIINTASHHQSQM